MRRLLSAVAATLTAGTMALAAEPVAPAAGADDPSAKVEAERRAKDAYFRDNPWSPLRAFARYDFQAGEPGKDQVAVVGSGKEADIRLEGKKVAERQLQMTVLPPGEGSEAWRFRLQRLDSRGSVRVDGKTLPTVGPDQVVPEETLIEVGPFALRPYVQSEAGIVILFDSRRTDGKRFVPPDNFPIDPAWRFQAPLVPSPEAETVRLQTSLGRVKEYRHLGHFEIAPPGRPPIKVQAYQPLSMGADAPLAILFTDETTGKETYSVGRYIDLDPPAEGVYTIDFNRAYNPLCAYTHVYNCPIPPQENRIPAPVRAGERTWPGKHD
jgi:hypothetical protein